MPKVFKDMATHLDEKLYGKEGLKPGQHGDFIITKSSTKTQPQIANDTAATDGKAE